MYSVCLTNGIVGVDENGKYLYDVIYDSCGHMHRTYATAEKCREKKINWSKDHRTCSARWYNSAILTVDRNGKHDPWPTEDYDKLRYGHLTA